MFVNNFVRRTGAAVFKNKRMMSGGHSAEEAHKEMAKWYKMTIGESPICQTIQHVHVEYCAQNVSTHCLIVEFLLSVPMYTFNFYLKNECILFVVMVGLSSLLTVYNIVAHDHEHERHGLPYQKIRAKPYPWKCGDCNLFDNKCWKECKEGH